MTYKHWDYAPKKLNYDSMKAHILTTMEEDETDRWNEVWRKEWKKVSNSGLIFERRVRSRRPENQNLDDYCGLTKVDIAA